MFGKYATKYPDMGLTVEELREFLVEECFVSDTLYTATVTVVQRLHVCYVQLTVSVAVIILGL